tara:strand:- start:600 stop:1184 length:585 start_codon:yes stop_codon:yes gene_type:complete
MAYKQHFIEWFSGKQLPSYWTTNDLSGTNTFAMADEVDGGFKITTASGSNNAGSLDFNDKRPFSATGSEIISVVKLNSTSLMTSLTALSNNGGLNPQFVAIGMDTTDYSTSLFSVGSMDSGFSKTDTDSALDTDWHNFKLILSSSDIKGYIDGVLKVTKTTNRPTLALQPHYQVRTRTTSSKSGQIRYMECYNT